MLSVILFYLFGIVLLFSKIVLFICTDSEPEELRRGADYLSDDPNYTPSSSSSTSSVNEEIEPHAPKKRKCYPRNSGESVSVELHSSAVPKLNESAVLQPRIEDDTTQTLEEREFRQIDVVWEDPQGRSKIFTFQKKPTVDPQMQADLANAGPEDFFHLFINDEIIDMMVVETNRYAEQAITKGIVEESISENSRLVNWMPVDRVEMLKFLGILGYMGLVNISDYTKYWSTDYLYKIPICSNAMSRNRFQTILRNWHFSNNEECEGDDRLHKLRSLTEKLREQFRIVVTPGEVVCVDESMVPYQGRLIIRQYLPNKAHKYGVKMFKLCCNRGYTWNFKIYEGKERDVSGAVPTNVVLKLSENLLGAGRTIVTDNYYTSIELAKTLLDQETHLLGTLRKNRKNLPEEVTKAKLKKGEVVAKESNEGILVLNWKDKRNVLMLSTKHGNEMSQVKTKRGNVSKPTAVVDYNEGKSHIDISDQMSNYNTSLRKSLFWYKKIALELIFGTSLVNSHIVYKLITNNKISITEFKENLVKHFLLQVEPDVERPRLTRRQRHMLEKMEGDNRKVRKGCKGCKQKKKDGLITKSKIKKVVMYCAECPEKPFYCLSCFNEAH